MLSPEIELADLDARQWTNWWRLLAPPQVVDRPRWAFAILDERRVIKLVIAGANARGSIDPDSAPLPGLTTTALSQWAKTLGVSGVVVIEREAIATLSAEIEGALRLEQDFVAQGLVALRALKKLAGTSVWTEPPLLELLPAPHEGPIQRTFDLLVPDRTALVAYVIDDDHARIFSSVIAVKDGGDIVRAGTHRAVADLVPEATFARAWHTNHARLISAIEERFAKPSIALFAEKAAIEAILAGPSDQLAREINAKRVLIDPVPAWLLGLLGGAAVAAMAGRAVGALAGFLPKIARDRAAAIKDRAMDAMKDVGPWTALGFDPIELWAQIKHYYRRS